MIHENLSTGIEWFYGYDAHGNIVCEKNTSGYEGRWEYKYDDKGNIIYEKDPSGKEYYYEYHE